jgi:intracellular sulfur oxidation DsrE/DsrF family protein
MTRSQIFRAMLLALFTWTAMPLVSAEQVPLQDKPFAEHKIVLQLSDGDAKKQALVLSVANNLLKAYDPDKVAIEVVAFGPGIDLLLTGSDRRKQVESLIAQGVRFDSCLNTVETIERETGKRPEFIPAATPVQVGVGQILFLAENGYTLVRP